MHFLDFFKYFTIKTIFKKGVGEILTNVTKPHAHFVSLTLLGIYPEDRPPAT